MVIQEEKKICFIIPAYNAEKVIYRCITNILKLSYNNYEIIVVNDGSTDKTNEVLESIDDKRLRVINQKNSGVSAARNNGIESTDADYIMFIDADDYLIPSSMDKFLLEINFDKELYMFNYEIEYNKQTSIEKLPVKPGKYSDKNFYNDTMLRLMDFKFSKNYDSSYFGGKVYQYLISTEFINRNQICFPVGIHFAEDCIFCFKMFSKLSTFEVKDIINYHYIVYDDSASHKYRDNYWLEIRRYRDEINRIYGKKISNESEIDYYYINDTVGRLISGKSSLNHSQKISAIDKIFSEPGVIDGIINIKFDNWTIKEKIVKSFICKKNAVAVYWFAYFVNMIRKVKKRLFR